MNTFVMWILARLKERSSWIGIISIISAIGLKVAPDAQEAIVSAGIAIVGAVLALTADAAPVITTVTTGAAPAVRDIAAELKTAYDAGNYATVATLSAELAKQ